MKEQIKATMQALMADEAVAAALERLQADAPRTMAEQMELCAIRAPSNMEEERSARYYEMYKQVGFDEVIQDEVGNVMGVIKGTGNGPTVMISGHLDTVFGPEIDCTPKVVDGVVYAPGIADDTRGIAETLSIGRVLVELGIRATGDIIVAGDVGEESAGNLRGMRHIFSKRDDIDGFLTIDGSIPGSITYIAIGSYKYKATYTGTGGHALGRFGFPNANMALGRAVAKIADIQVPTEPRTSFNVGILQGGVSIGSIPTEAVGQFDMRCTDMAQLEKTRDEIIAALEAGCAEENARWNHPTERVSVKIEQTGARPAGVQSKDAPIVQACLAVHELFGIESTLDRGSSTDANIPISLGIPALAIGRGGKQEYGHTVNEQWDSRDAHLGPQRALVLLLALAGYNGVAKPLLPKLACHGNC